MRVELRGISKGKNGETLPAVDVSYASGTAVLATAETEQRPTVLGLIASGRMVPDAGSVTIDGAADSKALRRRVALVDAPPVCDPEPNVTVVGLTVEELMFAGRPSTVPAAKRWLAENGFDALARTTIAGLVPRDRIALLMRLTALRPEVEGLVLVSPDRHRGEPAEWWDVARRFADDGYAVLVVAGAAAARVLGVVPEPEVEVEVEVDQDAAPEGVPDAASTAAENPPVVERGPQGRDETPSPEPADDPDDTVRFVSPSARSTTDGDDTVGTARSTTDRDTAVGTARSTTDGDEAPEADELESHPTDAGEEGAR